VFAQARTMGTTQAARQPLIRRGEDKLASSVGALNFILAVANRQKDHPSFHG
jgi:hypothetical protein